MTFLSFAQAASRLGIDVKTLHRWILQAQLPSLSSAHDGRTKGISLEHLHTLAHLHQRRLPFPPDPDPLPAPILPPALLALPEQLLTLQEQITALQHQVSTLTCLLQQHPPAPAIPLAPTPQKGTATPAPKPTSSPRAPRAAKAPSTSVSVLHRVEYVSQGRYVVISPKKGRLPFAPDSPEWFAWVAEQDSFRFVGQCGYFSAHHEWRVPKGAWRAHRHIRNRNYVLRLAPNHELTIAVLEQAAQALQAHLT